MALRKEKQLDSAIRAGWEVVRQQGRDTILTHVRRPGLQVAIGPNGGIKARVGSGGWYSCGMLPATAEAPVAPPTEQYDRRLGRPWRAEYVLDGRYIRLNEADVVAVRTEGYQREYLMHTDEGRWLMVREQQSAITLDADSAAELYAASQEKKDRPENYFQFTG